MLQGREKKVKEIKQSVELSRTSANKKLMDSTQISSDLMKSISKVHIELYDVIEEKQKAAETQAEGLVKELEEEITDLQKRSGALEQLSRTEDHVYLIQS